MSEERETVKRRIERGYASNPVMGHMLKSEEARLRQTGHIRQLGRQQARTALYPEREILGPRKNLVARRGATRTELLEKRRQVYGAEAAASSHNLVRGAIRSTEVDHFSFSTRLEYGQSKDMSKIEAVVKARDGGGVRSALAWHNSRARAQRKAIEDRTTTAVTTMAGKTVKLNGSPTSLRSPAAGRGLAGYAHTVLAAAERQYVPQASGPSDSYKARTEVAIPMTWTRQPRHAGSRRLMMARRRADARLGVEVSVTRHLAATGVTQPPSSLFG